jgi:hypothetical protein
MASPGSFIKGQVTDEFGTPLVGAEVYIEGASASMLTVEDGLYLIAPAAGYYDITFSMEGYETQTFPDVNLTVPFAIITLNVSLEEEEELPIVTLDSSNFLHYKNWVICEDLTGEYDMRGTKVYNTVTRALTAYEYEIEEGQVWTFDATLLAESPPVGGQKIVWRMGSYDTNGTKITRNGITRWLDEDELSVSVTHTVPAGAYKMLSQLLFYDMNCPILIKDAFYERIA